MCRSIKPLFNFSPAATEQEIKEASLQFVRKISGFRKPSKANENAFNQTVEKIAKDTKTLLESLKTDSKPRNREIEMQKAKERYSKKSQ